MQKIRRTTQNDPPILLVVSDHLGYLNTVRRALGRIGFTVVTSRSSKQSIDLVIESTIDVVLIDYDMAQMDGIALYEDMRKQCGNDAPPALITGENYATSLLSQCLSAGAAGLHVRSEPLEILVDRLISIVKDDDKRAYIEHVSSRRQVQGGTDLLTGLANKNHFNRRLSGESVASYRDKNHFSLLYITIDRYERSKESYGEDKLDNMLVQVGRLIEGELRSRDCVARYEESIFAITLPSSPLAAAEAVGKRLRRLLGSTEFGDIDEPLAITVSIGATTRPPGTLQAPEEMLAQAKRACEAAISMGGNRVVTDTALTGKPLILLVGDTGDIDVSSGPGKREFPVELRQAKHEDDAKDMIQSLPVAMLIAHRLVDDHEEGIDLLAWTRDRFPSVRRVLVARDINAKLMSDAVNKAAIDYFVEEPLSKANLPEIMDNLLFTT